MRPLELYIHIPFCVSKCKYCDFNSYNIVKSEKDRFLSDLKKEMSLYKNKDRKINSIFFGGGTPSILDNKDIKMIMQEIENNFYIDKDAHMYVIPGVDLRNAGNRNVLTLRTEPSKNNQGFQTYQYLVTM